jgi:hypothetical protein
MAMAGQAICAELKAVESRKMDMNNSLRNGQKIKAS